MPLATDRQRSKMLELNIPHDEYTSMQEAAEMIRDELKDDKRILISTPRITENSMVVVSDWED